MIAEPDVALTDYALVVETFLFGWWISRSNGFSPLKVWFVFLFWSIAVAALVGGTVHGFFPDPRSSMARVSWLLPMVFVGVTALAEYGIAAHLLLTPRLANVFVSPAVLIFGIYVAIVLF